MSRSTTSVLAAVLVVAIVSMASTLSHAAYIRLDTSYPVCFVEEVTYGSELIILQYTRKMFQSTSNQVVELAVTSPLTKTVVAGRTLREASQIMTFSPLAQEIGEYEICLTNMDAQGVAYSGRGVEIEILIDHQDRRLPLASATKDAAAALRHKVHDEEVFVFTDSDGQTKESLRTHDYLDRVGHSLESIDKIIEETTEEVHYFKSRQQRMRTTSESSFTRVWGFSVLVMSMLVAVSMIQFFSLRSFLKEKKVV